MKIERALWLDTVTRELWAVELRDDVVVICSGPIAGSDIVEDVLEGLEDTIEQAAWIERNRKRFVPLKPEIPFIPPT